MKIEIAESGKTPGMYTFASLYEQYDAAVHQGRSNPEMWLQNLTGRKREFCEWLKQEGGVRGPLSAMSIVSYVESVSVCSGYVRNVMNLDMDFYKIEDVGTVAKLAEVMNADSCFSYFTNFLQIQPTTAIKRYLDFCHSK